MQVENFNKNIRTSSGGRPGILLENPYRGIHCGLSFLLDLVLRLVLTSCPRGLHADYVSASLAGKHLVPSLAPR